MSVPTKQSTQKGRVSNQRIIQFPMDMGAHFMTFQFKNYSRSEPDSPPVLKTESTIALPLPSSGLVENVNVNYSEQELGLSGAAVRRIIGGSGEEQKTTNNINDADDTSFTSKVLKTAGLGAQAAGLTALEIGPDKIENAVSSSLGVTKNPHLARILQNVGLREHTFTWKLIPKNEKESIELRQIIGEFRYHSLPEVNGVVMKYPSECYVTLNGSEDGFLYFFKRCMISNIQVNYAPDNIPTFFAGRGAPAAVTLTVTLQETSALHRGDIAKYDPSFKTKLSTGGE